MTIPKIIHQIAPEDKSRWHPMWERCYPTWKECFPDFEHKLWNDNEEITEFVRVNYRDYFKLFLDFPVHIMRIDFVRFCLLHYYGGIYADMDMYCYKNFYNELTNSVMVVEAPYGEDFLESSLMVSKPNHKFWIDCMELSRKKFYNEVSKRKIQIPFNNDRASQYMILSSTGPNLICKVWRIWLGCKDVNTLSGVFFNNHGMSYHPEYRTKHMMTGMWGKEAVDYMTKNSKNVLEKLEDIYMKDVNQYVNLNKTTIKNFNFYKDYTNGGYKKFNNIDFDKNNLDDDKNLKNGSYT